MERTERVTLTNMCMVYDGTRVLVEEKVTRKGKGMVFPGGHVEEGEPVVDSVIREIFEETGLTIKAPRLCGIKDWMCEDGSRYIVFLFKTDVFSGELRSSSEGEVFWMELEDLKQTPPMWHMHDMLAMFTEGRYAELFLDVQREWMPVMK